jgi:hypothetical protein
MLEDKTQTQIDHLISIAQCRALDKINPLLGLVGHDFFNEIIKDAMQSDSVMSTLFSLGEDPNRQPEVSRNSILKSMMASKDWPTLKKLSDNGYNKVDVIAAYLMNVKIRFCEALADKITKADSRFSVISKWEWMLYIHQKVGRRIETVVLRKER